MPYSWNKAAIIRKEQIENGRDITFTKIFVPYYQEQVKKLNPKTLLEIGCGTGHLSLALSSNVNTIVAIDPAINMFNTASEVLKDSNVKVINTSIEELSNKKTFELIICHMCINTISDINLFFGSVKSFLKKNSLFIFCLPHPCFWNRYHPEWFNSFNYMNEQHLEVSLTITTDRKNPINNVPYIHRPLCTYFETLKSNGLLLIKFDEIFPALAIQKLYGELWNEPRYCVFHVRLE